MNSCLIAVALVVILYTTGGQCGPCNNQGHGGRGDDMAAQCTPGGFFQVVQHFPAIGSSWCVHPWSGNRVGKEYKDSEGYPTCGKCLYALSDYLTSGVSVLGRIWVSCDDDGNFKTFQTDPTWGNSWCVDRLTGAKVEGSEVPRDEHIPGKHAICN